MLFTSSEYNTLLYSKHIRPASYLLYRMMSGSQMISEGT